MKYCSLSFDELKIEPSHLARQMGYADDTMPTMVANAVAEILDEAMPLCDIRFAFAIHKDFQAEPQDFCLTLAEGACFSVNKVILRHLREANRLIFFVCTAGSSVTRWATQLAASGDPLASYIVDALGSVMVETAADIMHRRICGRMAVDGLKTTNRYSPGYCGWPLSDQPQLFSLFPPGICGVSLTSGCLMDPIKSISGIIGAGDKVIHTPYGCAACATPELDRGCNLQANPKGLSTRGDKASPFP